MMDLAREFLRMLVGPERLTGAIAELEARKVAAESQVDEQLRSEVQRRFGLPLETMVEDEHNRAVLDRIREKLVAQCTGDIAARLEVLRGLQKQALQS